MNTTHHPFHTTPQLQLQLQQQQQQQTDDVDDDEDHIAFILDRVKRCNKTQAIKLAAILKHNHATLCSNQERIMINLHASPTLAIKQATLFLRQLTPVEDGVPLDLNRTTSDQTRRSQRDQDLPSHNILPLHDQHDQQIPHSHTHSHTYRRPGILKKIAYNTLSSNTLKSTPINNNT
jgi:hypothetical protein